MKRLVLNMVYKLDLCETRVHADSRPLFLREVGKYFWNLPRIAFLFGQIPYREEKNNYNGVLKYSSQQGYKKIFKFFPTVQVLEMACFSCDLETVTKIVANGVFPMDDISSLYECVEKKHFEMIKFFTKHCPGYANSALLKIPYISGSYDPEIVEFLLQNSTGTPIKNTFFLQACSSSIAHVKLAFCPEITQTTKNDGLCKASHSDAYLDIVKFLYQKGADVYSNNDYAIRIACRQGCLEIVKFFVEECSISITSDLLSTADAYHQEEILKFLDYKQRGFI
jgi:hypothetical protein